MQKLLSIVYQNKRDREQVISIFFTCLFFWVNFLSVSGELALSVWSSSSFFTPLLVNEPLLPRTSFLMRDFVVLFPVVPVCAESLGVFTTKDEIDLSFLLAGNVISRSLSLFRFRGNILALRSCKMWSGLKCYE